MTISIDPVAGNHRGARVTAERVPSSLERPAAAGQRRGRSGWADRQQVINWGIARPQAARQPPLAAQANIGAGCALWDGERVPRSRHGRRDRAIPPPAAALAMPCCRSPIISRTAMTAAGGSPSGATRQRHRRRCGRRSASAATRASPELGIRALSRRQPGSGPARRDLRHISTSARRAPGEVRSLQAFVAGSAQPAGVRWRWTIGALAAAAVLVLGAAFGWLCAPGQPAAGGVISRRKRLGDARQPGIARRRGRAGAFRTESGSRRAVPDRASVSAV